MPKPVPAQETWTTRRLMAWMADAFTRKDIDSPQLSAELLMAHVLGCERMRLYIDADRPASNDERERLRGLVQRGLRHEPIQYLTGTAWFFGLPFAVDRRVLVPRPSTETIVDAVLRHARGVHGMTAAPVRPGPGKGAAGASDAAAGAGVMIADVCTGSGCVAIAILKHLPAARAVACDISTDALEVARANAARHGVSDRLDLLAGDLLEPLAAFPPTAAKGALNYLVANPPYIPDGEWAGVPPNVKDHEPEMALRAGEDGLRFIRPIVEHGPVLVRAGGLMLIEAAASTADRVLEMVRANPEIDAAEVLRDHEGLPRVISARKR